MKTYLIRENKIAVAEYTVVAMTVPADDPEDPPVQVVSYSATTEDNQTITQELAMHSGAASAEFASVPFRIEPGTLKFTVAITNGEHALRPSGTAGQPITMQYALSALVIAPPSSGNDSVAAASTATADMSTPLTVVRRFPHALATTYYLPLLITTESLDGSAPSSRPKKMVAIVAVFDVAEIDGTLQAINHSVALDGANSGVFVLTLVFPPMNSSLFYDPTIGLGLLLGGARSDGTASSGGGGDNMLLVVGVAVGLPLACIALVTVAVTTVVYKRRKRRQSAALRQDRLANFDKNDEDVIPPGPGHRPAYFSRFSVADLQQNSLWDGHSL